MLLMKLAVLFASLLSGAVPIPAPEGGPWPMTQKGTQEMEYGVVVDAGSSGSRARVYSWPPKTQPDLVPEIKEVYSYKEEPGISDFVDDLDALEPYVTNLVEKAAEEVPEELHAQTVLYFMATAGMRLLLEDRANAVMDKINSVLLDPDINPFSYQPLNTRILSGEEEGVFAWITVNYLNDFFNKHAADEEEPSVGIMEMGGASLQMAFQPEGSILADKFPVKVGGTIYPVYVHSYLYYGQNYAALWVKQYLYDEGDVKNNIPDPCMLREDSITLEIRGENVTYLGVGNPDDCMEILDVYVYHVDPRRCHPKPCSIGPVYQPSIPEEQDFFAIGAFIFPLRLLDVLEPDGSFSLVETNRSAYEYCVKDIWTVQNETGRTDPYLSVECLTGLYIPTLFVKSFKFSEDTTQVKAVDEINDEPTEWALGAIIYENERRDWACPSSESSGTSLEPSSPASVLLAFFICLLYNSNTSCTNSAKEVKPTKEDFMLFMKKSVN